MTSSEVRAVRPCNVVGRDAGQPDQGHNGGRVPLRLRARDRGAAVKVTRIIANITPRVDDPRVMNLIQSYLDTCDPGAKVIITCEVKYK